MKPSIDRSVLQNRMAFLLMLLGLLSSTLMGQVQTIGKWSTMSQTMPINPMHVALLANGKILVVAGSGNCPPSLAGCPTGAPYGPSNHSGALLFDPSAGSFTQFTMSWDVFCNAMVLLPDGRAFINGGTIQYDPFFGQPKSSIFDPATNTFTDAQNMAHGRWYPTMTTLGDGRVMTFSGGDENGNTNNTVEIYTVGSGWSQQITAPFTPDLYPRMHLLPNGKVFASGAPPKAYIFDPASSSFTQNVATTNYGSARTYGSSILLPLTPANGYDPKILILGGNSPATATTETIDMGAASPTWVTGPSMSQARIEMNAVILPNGKVLAMGGSVNDESSSSKSLNADMYDPIANTMSSAGANVYARLYHSVALLLPDATVWLAGGNPSRGTYETHMEIYQPPYLFQSNGSLATRPTISSAPTTISYGNPFTVQTPDAANISAAVLIRNGTVTHAFGMDQRMVGLSFTAGSGSLTVTAPPNGNIAPPGYYMLFLLNSSGVPSIAKFVQISSSSSSPSGINFVQQSYQTSTSASSLAVAYPGTQATGNLNVVAVGWNDTSSTISSVTDSKGNTYTRAVGPTVGTALTQSIYYAKNIAAGSNTVTVTFNKAAAYPDVRVLEYSGADKTNPLDVTAGASGSGTTTNSGSATTTSASEMVFGAGMSFDIYNAAGNGFANRVITNFGDIAEDKSVTSTGSYNATARMRASAPWVMQMATFRASGQGGTNPAPTVTGISPSSGTTAGGTAVTITGTGFVSGASVKLGGTTATNVTVTSSSTITATTPAHAAGTVDVVVTNSDSQSGTLSGGFTYSTSNPAPTVTGIAPSSGTANGGTGVTITGTGFLSGATVTFGGTAATGVTVTSSTTITATTPAHAVGPVDVVVTNTGGQSGTLTSGYTYTGSTSGAISFVQVAYKTSVSASSLATAYPAAQTAGNLNVVVVGWNDTSSSVSSITDTKGNTYIRAVGPTAGSALTQSIYYAKSIAGGTNTVTVVFNQTAAYPDVRVLEYSGADTTNPLDVTAAATGTGTTANSGSATTTSASELVFGAGMTFDIYNSAGTGFTNRVITNFGDIAEDKGVTSTGKLQCHSWHAILCTLGDADGNFPRQRTGWWNQSCANRDGHITNFGHSKWRYTRNHHRYWFPLRGIGETGRDDGDERDGGEQHYNHGDHAGTCGGGGELLW